MFNSPLFPVFVDAWEALATKSSFMLSLHPPIYKEPHHFGDEASHLWIDRAIVQKFVNRPEMFPFEVVDRKAFLNSFDLQQPELRAAMCAFSAQQSMPRAPPPVIKKYYDEARQLCLDALESPTLSTLQALLILSLCSVGKPIVSFGFLGMAVRTLELLRMNPKKIGNLSPSSTNDLELLRALSVCFLIDRMVATIAGKPAYMDMDVSELKSTSIKESTLELADSNGALSSAKHMLTAIELSDLLYIIRKEAEIPMNSIQDFYDRKEKLLNIESKLEDWRAFLPDPLRFEKFLQKEFREEDFFAEYGIAQIFCFSVYHLCVCLLHRPRLRLKRILMKENPILSSNPEHEINRRLVASSTKSYGSARALQYLVLVFQTKEVTPFQEDPIIGFSILVSSLVFVELMLITDDSLRDEVINTLHQDVQVFESCVRYLGLEQAWYDRLVEIVLVNDGSRESFEVLLDHMERPYTDMMGMLLNGSNAAWNF
ncbi:hypothetical protein HDU97_005682 [Phlyctochytrium planicorne]|nr:hypothetical protein HDU97_005682 [Phlyctochytrium planicorne]